MDKFGNNHTGCPGDGTANEPLHTAQPGVAGQGCPQLHCAHAPILTGEGAETVQKWDALHRV